MCVDIIKNSIALIFHIGSHGKALKKCMEMKGRKTNGLPERFVLSISINNQLKLKLFSFRELERVID